MQIAVIVRTMGVLLLLFSTTLLAPMVVWLIYDDGEFTHLALRGEGGLFVDGRWHLPGKRIVYTAQSLSLAKLEVLAHIPDRRQFPPLVYAVAEIPAALRIEEVGTAELPADWRRYAPYLHTTQAKGMAWLAAGDSAVLRVPSAVSEEEWNFLLNPEHGGFAKIALGTPRILSMDPRVP